MAIREQRIEATSLFDNALLVKSLQHVLKHFSVRAEYIFKKSCNL